MNPKKLSNDLDAHLGVSRAMQAVLVTFMLSTVLLSLALLLHRDEERVVMLPPQIDKSFWVDRDDVAPELLQEMGLFLVQLAYNVSPSSVDYQSKALLRYASPEAYGALSNAASVTAARMKADSSSTVFLPRAYLQDKTPGAKAVAFIGDLQTYVTNNLVATRGVAIVVRFKYRNGRLYVDEMKEAKQDDPFETKPAVGAR